MPTQTSLSGNGRALAQGEERNRLLRALEPDAYARLMDELELVELSAKQVLWPANRPIRSIYLVVDSYQRVLGPAGR